MLDGIPRTPDATVHADRCPRLLLGAPVCRACGCPFAVMQANPRTSGMRTTLCRRCADQRQAARALRREGMR